MKPLISVVVPIYNVEDYLSRCLNSLCRQSLEEIEILLIDDASPDHCGDICENFAARDNRFKVFHHQNNKGLSAARNTGLRNAVGDYLMFVDSDDWVHEDFCKIPYECAVYYHADLVMFNYQPVKGSKIFTPKHQNVTIGYKTREEAIELLLNNLSVWNKLYSRELFDDIVFPEGYMFEDASTTYKLFWKAHYIYFINKSLYYYQIRSGSISRIKSEDALNQWFEMNIRLYQGLLKKGYSKEKMQLYFNLIALFYCIRKKRDLSDIYYIIAMNCLKSIDNIPQNFVWKHALMLKLFQVSPTFFDFICRILREKINSS